MHVTPKLIRVVTYDEEFPPIKVYGHLNTWSCKVM